jgi:hypothetical protein
VLIAVVGARPLRRAAIDRRSAVLMAAPAFSGVLLGL